MPIEPKPAEKRFNDTLKRMLKTPPKPKLESGKVKVKPAVTGENVQRRTGES